MNEKALNVATSDLSYSTGERGGQLKIEIRSTETDAADNFRAAMERHMSISPVAAPVSPGKDGNSPGRVIADRVTHLASEIKKDQQYVSKMLERATRTGSEQHLVQAMMALSDFQIRVQTISKTVSKASTSIDSLTKLQ